ncbi:hypothetical protein BKA61DRAFT_567695 [Leptodontidium sp. MPI-SDFR-AT-0119]|nr:hypothetical protein BKA61DRAFT_567695 [Leptodontidium sp. MPI-SDFR-AT-0119]
MAAFPGFNLTDVSTIRLLARALSLYASGNHRNSNNDALRSFDAVQRSTFSRILGEMERDQSFEGLVRELLRRQHQSDRTIVQLAADLLSYGEGAHTAPPTQPAPRPVLEPGSDAFRKLLQTSYLQYADGKLPEKAEGPVQNPDSDTETDSEHDVQEDPDLTMPVMHDDCEVIWDESKMHRRAATPGAPDPSFYKIVIHLRKKTASDKVKVPSIKFDYLEDHEEPTWEIGSDSLYKLNQWRNQIFRNYLGNKRATRGPYLVSEQQLIIDLLKQQLEDPQRIRSAPHWGRLVNSYNRLLSGSIQPKGSRLVQEGVKKKPVLDYDRSAPWRSKGALKNIITKPSWKDLIDPILEAAVERRARYDRERNPSDSPSPPHSRDEKEIPNPTPGPISKEESKALAQKRRDQRKEELKALRKRARDAMAGDTTEEDGGDEESSSEEEPSPKKKQKRSPRNGRDMEKRGPGNRDRDNDEGKVAPIRRNPAQR